MTFSSQVKNELSLHSSSARHCQIAEISAIVEMCGGICISQNDRVSLKIHTENRYVARRYAALLHRTFRISVETGMRKRGNSCTYCVAVPLHKDSMKVLSAIHMTDEKGSMAQLLEPSDPLHIRRTCCSRAYLRGVFLAAGSISDPRKFYHLEIVCLEMCQAQRIQEMLRRFNLTARIVERKGRAVLYMKDGPQIVEMLAVMEAANSLMELENIRILHEISNDVNRRVNCEAANITKTVSAAVRQTEDIRYIIDRGGLSLLPDTLQEIAQVRLSNPDMALADLGALLDPPLGKSGANHRLKRISRIADQLRGEDPSFHEK